MCGWKRRRITSFNVTASDLQLGLVVGRRAEAGPSTSVAAAAFAQEEDEDNGAADCSEQVRSQGSRGRRRAERVQHAGDVPGDSEPVGRGRGPGWIAGDA